MGGSMVTFDIHGMEKKIPEVKDAMRAVLAAGFDADYISDKLLSENDWKNADVLMISDFVMNGLGEELQKLIETEKDKNTCFYSLVIGGSGNRNAIECFNHNWVYNTADPQSQRHLVEQLHELKVRKNEN